MFISQLSLIILAYLLILLFNELSLVKITCGATIAVRLPGDSHSAESLWRAEKVFKHQQIHHNLLDTMLLWIMKMITLLFCQWAYIFTFHCPEVIIEMLNCAGKQTQL